LIMTQAKRHPPFTLPIDSTPHFSLAALRTRLCLCLVVRLQKSADFFENR
jgi:hypothetical protein